MSGPPACALSNSQKNSQNSLSRVSVSTGEAFYLLLLHLLEKPLKRVFPGETACFALFGGGAAARAQSPVDFSFSVGKNVLLNCVFFCIVIA